MKFIIAIIFLLNAAICFSQNNSDSTKVFLTYGFGYHNQTFYKLKGRFAYQSAYEKPGDNIFSANLGYNVERKHLLFDANFVFGNSLTGNVNKRSSSVSMFNTALSLGYNFSSNQNLRIYPLAGLSFNTYLTKLNKDISAIPFDSVLQSNTVQQRTEPLTFANNFICYQTGFGIDFTKQKGRYIRSIGIRASYTGSFSSRTWRINDTQLLGNAPSDNVNQFNVSLQLGIGRYRRTGM